MMVCPRCNSPLEPDSVFCGVCGNQVAPLNARGATAVADATELLPNDNSTRSSGGNYATQNPPYEASYGPSSGWPGQQRDTPASPYTSPTLTGVSDVQKRRLIRNISFAVIFVLLVTGVTAGLLAYSRSSKNNASGSSGKATATTSTGGSAAVAGTASFSDSQNGQGQTNTIKITAAGLKTPPSGSNYMAWLFNSQSENIVPLGKLTLDGSNYTVTTSTGATNLLSEGDQIKVTLEEGTPTAPTGQVVLVATEPPLAFVHVRHLLLSFPTTPNKVGLLVGLRSDARALNAQATLLHEAPARGQIAVQCIAQNIVNLVEGNNGANFRPLSAACLALGVTPAGDGFGLLGANGKDGYIGLSAAHAALAATQSDTTENIRIHAGHVRIATDNITGWVNEIDREARILLTDANSTKSIQEIVTLSDHTLNGVDINGDERVDPIPGEAGTLTAYAHGQLMAQLSLVPQR